MKHGKARGLCLLFIPLVAAAPAPEAGRWLTQNHASVIDIYPCGAGLCGSIVGVSLDHPTDPEPVDKWGRPQCNDVIIQMPRYGVDHRWHGTILDPRSGANWTAELWAGPDGLHLRGYIGITLIGGTQVWTSYQGAIGQQCHFIRPEAS